MSNKKALSTKVDPSIHRKLQEIADEKQITKSSLVRNFVQRGVANYENIKGRR